MAVITETIRRGRTIDLAALEGGVSRKIKRSYAMRNKGLAILSGIAIVASMLALTPVPAEAGWAGGGGYHGGERGGFRGGSYMGRSGFARRGGAYSRRYAGGYYHGGRRYYGRAW